ncbi:MAG TPA: hypothetical protein VGG19_03220 [Tepidisphaeraceae bacterium]|jgi:hypothetical protein
MKTVFQFSLLLICAIGVLGCAETKPFSMMYTTQSLPRGKAAVNAGTFAYTPANRKVAQDQIENTAVTAIHIDSNISDYVKRAFMQELDRSGYFSTTPAILINCQITRFKCDDLGYSVDWYLDLTCHFVDAASQKELATETVNIQKKHMQKFGGIENFQRAMNNVIYEAYDEVISAPKVQSLLK